jgi:hypothetical protein
VTGLRNIRTLGFAELRMPDAGRNPRVASPWPSTCTACRSLALRLPQHSPRGPAIWRRRTLGLLGLMASVGIAATVFGHLLGNKDGTMRTAGVPAGCLAAAVEPLGRAAVAGRGALCVAETGTRGILDLEHLEPGGQYVEWIAYFDRPWACSLARPALQAGGSVRPCTLSDLDGANPPGALHRMDKFVAGANGDVHVEGFVVKTAS